MNFELNEDQIAIREAVGAVAKQFDDHYWSEKEANAEFPHEFHKAMADGGWLGITMPEEYGGAGLGVTEAAIMMNEVCKYGGGSAAVSTIHINLFGPHPIIVFGTEEQKAKWIPPLIRGEDKPHSRRYTRPDGWPHGP